MASGGSGDRRERHHLCECHVSLCFYVAGKHGLVRGLLYFGTFAALCNTALWVFVYRGLFNAHIY
jgi:hypothetical protein